MKNQTKAFNYKDLPLILLFFSCIAIGQVQTTFGPPRFSETLNGNVTIIANNVLSEHSTNNYNGSDGNHNINTVFVDIDTDTSTFNSSRATFSNPKPSISCLNIEKVFLYWAAADKEYSSNTGPSGGSEPIWNYNQLKLMLPGQSSYSTITADEVIYRGRDSHFENDPYVCFKDITTDVNTLSSPFGNYQIANLKAVEEKLQGHGGGNTGTSGGWQIVIIYESPEISARAITFFDGYAHINSSLGEVEIPFDGFLTVPTGNVNADIIIGAIEGDRDLIGDELQILDPTNTWQNLSTPLRDDDNFFNSRITVGNQNFTNRLPASTNTLGFDAALFDLQNTANKFIQNNQTHAILKITSSVETYGVYLIGMSIEVYEPSLGALNFTTSNPSGSYAPGDILSMSMSLENTGNDNVNNLEISTTIPPETDFVNADSLPPGVSHTFNTTTGKLVFTVDDGYLDVGDPEFSLDFDIQIKDQCYFLEGSCAANFQIQATANFTGETNTNPVSSLSSGTMDACGIGQHDPTIVNISAPNEVNWSTPSNDLDRTVLCSDSNALNDAQSLEPTTEFCNFTLNKTTGAFIYDPSCEGKGTYTNTWVFTDGCGRVSDTFTQTITINDTESPAFNETLPQDTVAAYTSIPNADTLTALDNCDTNASVSFNETYIGDNSGTTYTVVRTWTGTDCSGNSVEHTQNIFVTENGDPIGVAINNVSVNEVDAVATFTITHTGNVTGGFSVDYTTSDATAIAGNDYTTTTNTQNFSGTHGESYIIDIPILDDNMYEETQQFNTSLSNLTTGLTTITNAVGEGTIIDDDNAIVSTGNYDIDEDAGTINLRVFLSDSSGRGGVEDSFTVDVTTSGDDEIYGGTATDGDDYTGFTTTVTFPANSPAGTELLIPLTIIDDNLIEPLEQLIQRLGNISNTNIGMAGPGSVVRIHDNDAVSGTGIYFDSTSVTVSEDAGTASFRVALTGNVAGGFTLDYVTADDAATAENDYTTGSGTLTFSGTDGEFYDITVPIIDDSLIESSESFFVNLSGLSTGLIGINTPQATGNITDNDAVNGTGIDFDSTSVTVNEDAGTASFRVALTGNVAGGFTLDYATADDTATAENDYTTGSGTLTFSGTDGEFYDITVPIIDDSLIESSESFFVNLSALSTSLIGINTPQATGNITDNDAVNGTGIDFDSTSVTVNEDAGTASFRVALTGNVAGGFTLDYVTADDAATAGNDYTAGSGTLTFSGTDGEFYDITVPIIDDSLIESSESFFVNLSALSTGLIGINTPQATGNITDNDAVNGTGIDFDSTSVTVNEDAGTASFRVALTGNVAGGFTLDYATADDTATAGNDYTAGSGTLTFSGTDGEFYDITVPIIDDSLIESSESFFVNLSGLSTGLIGINTPQATGNITDNDAVNGTGIDFDSTSVTVNEDAGTASFRVALTGNVAGGFTLDYATADDTATAENDYTTGSGTLTFSGTDGEFYDITVPIIDDSLIESSESFFVNLSALSTSLIGINTPQATGNITDNDAVNGTGIYFDSTSVTVNEDAGTASFRVALTGNVAGGFTLDYATADDTATAGNDYTTGSGTLTFSGTDGEFYDITVPIIDDSLIESSESFLVNLSGLSTGLIGINTPQATGNITDNDSDPSTLGVQFDLTSINVNEDAGTVSIDVSLNAQVQEEFTVEFNTADGSATSPEDYTAQTNQTLTFGGANTNNQTITIPIIDDVLIESTEDFQVVLSNISSPLVGILTNDTATIHIIDNDSTDGYPKDITIEACDDIPIVEEITSNSTCSITTTLEETIARQNDDCPAEYIITRKWTITDCVNNTITHTQIITIEDTVTPTFVESLPTDITVLCNEVPEAAILTAVDTCDTNIEVTFNEIITNDANCIMGYQVIRTWTSTDCAGNETSHTQTITIEATGPITASDYEKEVTVICGEEIPEIPTLEFMGGCGNYEVSYNEEVDNSGTSDDYIIIRTWSVIDSCGNSEEFEQLVFVMQPQLEEITIEICVKDDIINLVDYLPQNFDRNGDFVLTSGNATLDSGLFNPDGLVEGDYIIEYSSTESTCKYYADITIKVDSGCVPCSPENMVTSDTVTANGDGVNDVFEITGLEYCDYTFKLSIFNRWGTKVYESNNYQNNWNGAAPDNSFGNLEMLPSGTYYYLISIVNTEFQPINGYIYLGSDQ